MECIFGNEIFYIKSNCDGIEHRQNKKKEKYDNIVLS